MMYMYMYKYIYICMCLYMYMQYALYTLITFAVPNIIKFTITVLPFTIVYFVSEVHCTSNVLHSITS